MARRKANDMDLWVLQNLFPVPNLVEEELPLVAEMYIQESNSQNDSVSELKERILKLEKENKTLRLTKDNINKDNKTLKKLLAKLMETI